MPVGDGSGSRWVLSISQLVASDLIEHGFAAALHGGYPTADEWDQVVDIYGRDDMTLGASEIQKRLAADLVVQQQLDTPCRWAVGAKLATLYGKTFPGSNDAKAATWYRHAATFADRSATRTPRSGCAGGRPLRWAMRVRLSTPPTSWPSRRSRLMRGPR
ncbi:MAG TPA: hypothetical protein VJT72_11555 [Pseudonocardiaceae bacterium]|nr:hypothetical protein [Pseudonocardiaceae bacterium]